MSQKYHDQPSHHKHNSIHLSKHYPPPLLTHLAEEGQLQLAGAGDDALLHEEAAALHDVQVLHPDPVQSPVVALLATADVAHQSTVVRVEVRHGGVVILWGETSTVRSGGGATLWGEKSTVDVGKFVGRYGGNLKFT